MCFFLKILWFFWTLPVLLQRWFSTCLVCVHTLTPRENRVRNFSKNSEKTQYLMNTLYHWVSEAILFKLYLYIFEADPLRMTWNICILLGNWGNKTNHKFRFLDYCFFMPSRKSSRVLLPLIFFYYFNICNSLCKQQDWLPLGFPLMQSDRSDWNKHYFWKKLETIQFALKI